MTSYLVCGLGFGDEGKGSVVDALVRKLQSDLVIRYNGGPQCAHNVVTPEGRHHTFAQFGSGTFVPGVRTYLSKHVLINPVNMLIEAEKLDQLDVKDALSRTSVDGKAPVVTRFQRSLNRLEEISRANQRHGSTGMGIGTTRRYHLKYGEDVLLVEDLPHPTKTREKLEFIREKCLEEAKSLEWDPTDAKALVELLCLKSSSLVSWYLDQYKTWCAQVAIRYGPPNKCHNPVFEGGQGLLLDEKFGFSPHTTWSDITFNNAYEILQEMGSVGNSYRIGVIRSYFTRHGNGPFPSEDLSLLEDPLFKEEHNTGMEYTGKFRVGHFDMSLLKYAIKSLNGIDGIALNHLDIAFIKDTLKIILEQEGQINCTFEDFVQLVEQLSNVPIVISGCGPSAENKSFDPYIWEPVEKVYQN